MIETHAKFSENLEARNSPFNTLAQRVTIRRVEDIRDAAIALHEMAQARGFRVAACDDISSKEPMVDADGAIINGEIFGWKIGRASCRERV